MAEMDKGTSGKANKTSKQKGRSKKSTSKQATDNTGMDNELTCSKCEAVFVDIDDKLLECERCDKWFCIQCAGMEPSVYSVMVANKNLHWFCHECEKPALTAVKSDKEIEEKCAAYMSSLTAKIDCIEEKVEGKADKSVVKNLQERVVQLEKKGTDNTSAIQQNSVSETIYEQREREFRARNLVIQNLPESSAEEPEERNKEDMGSVGELLKIIGITEEAVVEKCMRIGKKEDDKTRITKIIVNSVETKKAILKDAKRLKNETIYKEVFIGPDLTKMEREEQFNLRKELRDRKGNGEKDIFIRGGKIVQAKDKALRFKGGASGSAGER
ncbi:uncharacterized protein LOC128221863 [Mya arenaria]|uniref:uncharacterized protein LOC128221863 n=1 Tax=Mya arenaria TaxID=6604 RepID=UPI0022E21D50|nr:uncharacterized protein LOC128221863 [Mya arenaria]